MNPNSNTNLAWLFLKKYRVVIIIAVVLFVVFVLFVLISRREISRTPTQYKILNIPSVGLNESFTNNKVLRFFNGRNFVDYDLASGQTSRLLEDQEYPKVTELSWSPNGEFVIFKSSQHLKEDYLGKRLINLGKPLTESYWWTADLKGKKISYVNLASVIKQPIWSMENELKLLSYTNFAEGIKTKERVTTQVYSYNLATGKISSNLSIPGSIHELLWVGKNGFMFTKTSDGKTYQIIKTDGSLENPKELASNNSPISGVSSDGKSLYKFSRNNEQAESSDSSDKKESEEFHNDNAWFEGSLNVIDVSSGNELVKIDDLISASLFAFDEKNNLWAITTNHDADINLTKHSLKDDKNNENFIIENSNVSMLDMLDLFVYNDSAYIKSSLGYGVVTDQEIKSQDKKLVVPMFSSNEENPFIIKQSNKDLSVIVTIFSKPVEQNKKKAIDLINDGGVDANLLDVEFDDSPTRDITRN